MTHRDEACCAALHARLTVTGAAEPERPNWCTRASSDSVEREREMSMHVLYSRDESDSKLSSGRGGGSPYWEPASGIYGEDLNGTWVHAATTTVAATEQRPCPAALLMD